MSEIKEMYGECKFCGQQFLLTEIPINEDGSAPDFNELATMKCDCKEGREYRDKTNDLEEAFENIKVLFAKFPETTSDFLKEAAIAVRSKFVDRVTVKLSDEVTATVKLKGCDHIAIERKKTEKTEMETR